MKYQFGNINRVATVEFDFGIEPQKLLRKLEKLPWEENNTLRSFCKQQPEDQFLLRMLELVKSPKFRLGILKHLYKLDHGVGEIYGQYGTNGLQWLWNGRTYQVMNKILGYDAYFVKDLPGYTTHLHLDRLGQPFVGMIYLNETNPHFETDFYDSKQRTNHFAVPHKYCTGWLQANHVNTWHEGKNRSQDKIRYSLLFSWGFRDP